MIKSEKTPVLVHIPKTGGTSIRNTLGLPKFLRVHRRIGEARMMRMIESKDDPYVFTFLRCPIDRAISGYYHFVTNKLNGRRRPPHKLNAVRRTAWLISTVAAMGDLDLNKFLRALFKDDAFHQARLSHVVVHFNTQSYWMNRNDKLKAMCNYYDFGNFAEEYKRLLSDIGAENRPRLKHMMRSKKRPKQDTALDPDVEEMLRDFYADDFALLDNHGIPHA